MSVVDRMLARLLAWYDPQVEAVKQKRTETARARSVAALAEAHRTLDRVRSDYYTADEKMRR